MNKLNEPEALATLKHRWGRTIEMWVAYQVFLNDEVKIGSGYICWTKEVAEQATHTLLTCYYSYLFSLFDPSGINFEKITNELELDEKSKQVRGQILDHWQTISLPMAQIRNNIGFHGSPKEKGKEKGYSAYFSIHPLSSEYLGTLLRVFFRLLEQVYVAREQIARPAKAGEIESLLEHAGEIKNLIDSSSDKFSLEPLLRFASANEDTDGYVN